MVRVCVGLAAALLTLVSAQSHPPAGTFLHIAAGQKHTCALKSGNELLVCWGRNGNGQTDSPPGRFTTMSCGGNHCCAINVHGKVNPVHYPKRANECNLQVKCWGDDAKLQSSVPTGEKIWHVSAGFEVRAIFF